jgi:LPXTG-motif cell wall-anchored protein
MGTIITDSSCEEGVTLAWRPNGPNSTPIPGTFVVIKTPTGDLGPLATTGIIDAEPNANYVVEFYGYATNGDGTIDTNRIVLHGSHPVTTPGLPTDCTVDEPTTTTPSPAPTAPPEVTESTTALAPPSTIATAIDMDVDPCVTSATGCTVAVGVPPTLPATGDSYIPEITAGVLLAAGAVLTLVARRRKPTAAQKRQIAARLHEVTS